MINRTSKYRDYHADQKVQAKVASDISEFTGDDETIIKAEKGKISIENVG